jgi:membrane-associated PAP2 superfamily phosphatase
VLLLCLGAWWPQGWLARLPFARRLQLAVSTLVCVLAVAAVKSLNASSCPWDLGPFGGLVQPASHWQGFLAGDGGSGHCFPAGHASAGFAFMSGYFAFRQSQARLARAWLALATAGGLVLGLGQQLRGAHFLSHTLWTAALCWAVSWGLDRLWPRWEGAL